MKKLLIATCTVASLWFAGNAFAAEEAAAAPEVDMETLNLLQESACLNCHNLTPREKVETDANGLPFGPPYLLIAQRYHDDPEAFESLLNTIRQGSNPYSKHWKEESAGIAMPPMITVSDDNLKTLLTWILNLDEAKAAAAEAALEAKPEDEKTD